MSLEPERAVARYDAGRTGLADESGGRIGGNKASARAGYSVRVRRGMIQLAGAFLCVSRSEGALALWLAQARTAPIAVPATRRDDRQPWQLLSC